MKRWTRSMIVAASMLFGACAPTGADRTPGETPLLNETAGQGTFTLTTETDYELVGTWSYADVVIQFESRMSEEGVSNVRLVVNGAEFETRFDYFTHAWQSDGHQNTLFRPELDALLRLGQHIDNAGHPGRPWERLYTVVSQHAAAPAGYTFLQRSGSPSVAEETPHRESNAVANNGVTYICRGNNGRNMYNNWDTFWGEHDSLSGEGGSSRNATAGNTYHGRVFNSVPGGCRVGRAVSSGGNGRGSCEGRCGAGCPRTYNYYFTYDCFDHDICLDFHPAAPTVSYSGDCGYEFSDADGDFAGGTSLGYSWSCGSVPSNCEDNGNSVGSGS